MWREVKIDSSLLDANNEQLKIEECFAGKS